MNYGVENKMGTYCIDPAKTDIVKSIFGFFVSGLYTLIGLARNMNKGKIDSPNGKKWTAKQVKSILSNHIYVDLGIIDEGTYRKAEYMLKTMP